ncbi:MAG: glycosyltransferase [Acidobacteria bacterium]|nr:glycosyltransferase [Acidobacteriota bacterium]
MSSCSTDGAASPRVPQLSAVVVAFNGGRVLTECLEALTTDSVPDRVEILVVYDPAGSVGLATASLGARFPKVHWLGVRSPATVPRLRAHGMAAARGDVIALLEDDCVVERGWCEAAIAAHNTEHLVIGGAVEPGPYKRALDWAVYFCEYGRFTLPLQHGMNIVLALAANNVTYKRTALARVPSSDDGFYDMFVHAAWERAGVPMRTDRTLVVRNVNAWSLAHVTSVPYHHGRAFAGHRAAGRSGPWRAAIGLLALGLPILKLGRIVSGTASRKRLAGRLLQALPWMVVFNTSWSLGEAVGYVRGPGDSATRWR